MEHRQAYRNAEEDAQSKKKLGTKTVQYQNDRDASPPMMANYKNDEETEEKDTEHLLSQS